MLCKGTIQHLSNDGGVEEWTYIKMDLLETLLQLSLSDW